MCKILPTFEASISSFVLLVIKFILLTFDLLTTPFYAFYQHPWKKVYANCRVRAQLENPSDPYSAYVRVRPEHEVCKDFFVFEAKTIAELQQMTVQLFPLKQKCLGYRKVRDVCQVMDEKCGKVLTKFDLAPDYVWFTNEEVDRKIGQLARAFCKHGIRYQQPVVIFSETRMEWFLCAQALFRIGSIVATLYATLGLEGIIFGVNETEVEHVITTEDLLPNILKVVHRLPNIRKIYVIQVQHKGLLKFGNVTQQDFDNATVSLGKKIELITFTEMLSLGRNTLEGDVSYSSPKTDDIAIIQYTSGSTGHPKGVIQTHRNWMQELRSLYSMLHKQLESKDQHCYLAYLPLAHSIEMDCELYFYSTGGRLGYSSPHTMTDNSTSIMAGQNGDIKVLKPTVMAGVPLVLDRIRKSLTSRLEGRCVFWTDLFKYICAYKNFWVNLGYDTPLINRLICKKVQAQLGGRVQFMFISGAPLSPDTHRVMRAFLNVKFHILYGCTETTGGVTASDIEDLSIGRIGAPLHNIKIRLIDWPEGGYSVRDKPNPRGEIVAGGDSITRGYFKLPSQTAEAFEEKDGVKWFKTGDIAEVFPNGTFKIVDRKKDLVKLQFGEYISLGKVESELKSFKYIENVCVYGDSNQLYVIAFICPNIAALKNLSKELNKPDSLTLEQLCTDREIVERVTQELHNFGLEAGLNKMEIPQKIKLCHEEWTVAAGFLTATMKINRQGFRKIYQRDIYKLYGLP